MYYPGQVKGPSNFGLLWSHTDFNLKLVEMNLYKRHKNVGRDNARLLKNHKLYTNQCRYNLKEKVCFPTNKFVHKYRKKKRKTSIFVTSGPLYIL